MRVAGAIGVLLLTVASVFAAETLPLGAGTACVLVSEHETKAMFGLKKRHVLACADPTGKVVRVVVTRKGTVDCVDGVQVARDGSGTVVGRACPGITPTAAPTVPPVFNLTGSWTTTVYGLGTCATDVDQDGDAISITADCSLGAFSGTFSGSGTITFRGFAFDSHGSADVPGFGHCDDGELSGSVTHDGQHIDGQVSCFGASLSISADRR
jgi:hypothetical protein